MRRRELTAKWVVRENVAPTLIYNGPCRGPDDLLPYLEKWAGEAVECLILVALDAKMSVIGHREVSRGTQVSCVCEPREVMRAALLSGGAAFILSHNHPSGSTTPSLEDIQATKNILAAAAVVGVPMLDHVITGIDSTGNPAHCSMKQTGMMS